MSFKKNKDFVIKSSLKRRKFNLGRTGIITSLVMIPVLTLISCNPRLRPDQVYIDTTNFNKSLSREDTEYIVLQDDKVTPLTKDTPSLFNTATFGIVYNIKEKQIDPYLKRLQILGERYHAFLDKTHYYFDVKSKEVINNLRVINESYPGKAGTTSTTLEIDKILYDSLLTGLNFTINSENRFSIFSNELATLYMDQINYNNDYFYQEDVNDDNLVRQLDKANLAHFGFDVDTQKEKEMMLCVPKTEEEIKSTLVLDHDEQTDKYTVTFNKFKDCEKLSLTLGGYGKGRFVNDFIQSYYDEEEQNPSLKKSELFISSGSSSIKTKGHKSNGEPYRVKLTNNIFVEQTRITGGIPYNINQCDRYVQFNTDLNISTSGYAEKYFYVPYIGDKSIFDLVDLKASDDEKNALIDQVTSLKRVSHIADVNKYDENKSKFSKDETYEIDTVTVILEDAGLADMYTTALYNTYSLEETISVKNMLDSAYNVESNILITYKDYSKSESHFRKLNKIRTFENKDNPANMVCNPFNKNNHEECDGMNFNYINFDQMYLVDDEIYSLIKHTNKSNDSEFESKFDISTVVKISDIMI